MAAEFIMPVLILVAYTIPLWILSRIVLNVLRKKKFTAKAFEFEIILLLFYFYIIFVVSLTILPLPFARFQYPNRGEINLIPVIKTIKDVVDIFSGQSFSTTNHTIQNIIGNLILFFPLGIFLPVISKTYQSLKKIVIIAFICSASIETIQFISRFYEIYRFVDIDDVILNTSGAALGFITVKAWKKKSNFLNRLMSDSKTL